MIKKHFILLIMIFNSGLLIAAEIDFKHTIESKVLNESREVWVSLPASYGNSNKKYPLLYVLDAYSHFTITSQLVTHLARSERIPEMIVVGLPLIESDDLVRDRIRDYSPTHVELAPGLNDGRHWQLSGQAHIFRQFIFDEVMPLITSTYRTEQMNILAGHSQGGLFATDTLLAGGSRFKGYIAASPSFWWDDQMMISKFSEWVQATESSAFYYFSVASGDKPEAQHPINKIHDLLSYQAPNPFNWKFDYFSNETHSSIVLKSYYEGLMYIFRRYPIPESALNGGSESVNKHYKRLSDELGYTMLPSEIRINSLGYKQMWNSNVPAAIEFFLWNVKTYPASANAEDSLAEAYANFGDTEKAITHYQKSLALNPNNKNALNMLKKLALKSEDKERGHP